jgi:aminoglycoside phosphotransferase (APT) family kinase protein
VTRAAVGRLAGKCVTKGLPLEPRDWLQVVAAAYVSEAANESRGGVSVHRVAGGANNALYRVESGGQQYACKLCVADERRRAMREYGVLYLLQAAGANLAPQPLLLDESCTILPFPAVVYRWLPGEPLGPSLTAGQLAALLQSIQQIHAFRRDDLEHAALPDAWFHWFDFCPYLAELDDFLATYGGWLVTHEPAGRGLRDRLARLVDRCARVLSTATVNTGRGHVPLCLCRVDANLANAIWDQDGRLRWVDWEYGGWGDPALDLADMRWHVALEGMSEAQHAWLRKHYARPADDPGFEARLALWDRLLSTRWPFLILRSLWSTYNGSDRVRLTRPDTGPTELRARLVRTIERAERFAQSQDG